jgi:glycosyltransferase involved in cell wall biosynthesis
LVVSSLERVLDEFPLFDRVNIIIVDDGPTDQTVVELENYRVALGGISSRTMEWLFIRHETNEGKTAAIRFRRLIQSVRVGFEEWIAGMGLPGGYFLRVIG